MEEVYSGGGQHQRQVAGGGHQHQHQHPGGQHQDTALPASLAAARPGSRLVNFMIGHVWGLGIVHTKDFKNLEYIWYTDAYFFNPRSGITGTPSDPRFANYEEIQRHLSRRQVNTFSNFGKTLNSYFAGSVPFPAKGAPSSI